MFQEKHLCYDQWSGRHFKSTISEIETACLQVNAMLFRSGDACVNDYYEILNLPPIPPGYTHGWSGVPVEMQFGSMITDEGAPAIVVAFRTDPKHEQAHVD